MEDSTLPLFIQKIDSDEKGIRLLKQGISSIISKISFLVHHQNEIKMSFSFTFFLLSFTISCYCSI